MAVLSRQHQCSKIPLDSDILRRFFWRRGQAADAAALSIEPVQKGRAWNDELLPTLKKRK
ncbi:hypothetical protein NITMOv2_2387 [Nitrospira moscoviensis]|uniref:Uncharacterized protein n=1 Tax=Nitrospira moscoviensis TaxID=42253 RepID=A0A0K2GDX0_NITMO|nr:hypothetical protein NITMOv2_2387 [Nitrospira moscoviensis]